MGSIYKICLSENCIISEYTIMYKNFVQYSDIDLAYGDNYH